MGSSSIYHLISYGSQLLEETDNLYFRQMLLVTVPQHRVELPFDPRHNLRPGPQGVHRTWICTEEGVQELYAKMAPVRHV